jgi:hypothetical protein
MSSPHRRPVTSHPSAPLTLTERLLERVRQAGLAVHQSRDAPPTARPRRRHTDPPRSPKVVGRTPEQVREARSLRRVFLDMGDTYREYRRRTGAPLAPEVKEAADRFRRERSVTSLTAVAASLDELEILPW